MPNFYSTLRRFALTTLLSGGGLLAAQAQIGQTVTGATNVAGTYTDLGTTGTVITTANTDNANSAAQNIGFTFGFNGVAFTQFVLNTNGAIRLGSAAPSSAALYYDNSTTTTAVDPLQSTNAADVNLILPFNADLIAGSGTGGAEYRVVTTGNTGARVCTIQWKNVADKAGTGAANAQQLSNFSFQVKLYEATGTVEFVYGTATASTATATARFADVGLKGSGIGLTGQLLLASKANTVAWSAATFRSSNYGANTFDYANTPLPDAGRTYRFTDPSYCVAGAYAGFPAAYTQSFDGVAAPILPCGVTVIDANGDGTTWKNAAVSPNSSPNAMQYMYNGTNSGNDWFFTNGLTMTAGMSYQLQFKYRGYGSLTEAMEVKVGSAATVAAQTTTVFTNNSFNSNTYTTTVAGSAAGQVLLYTPTASGVYYFGFHAISIPNQWYIYVDDVQVTEQVAPACPQPTAVVVSGITTTGATVTFSGPTAGTSYNVIYVPKGTTPTATSPSVPATASPATLSGLSSNTNYDVYVQAVCGTAGSSTMTGPISFLTACATATTFPYTENFDGVTAPALPCGITLFDANADGKTWVNTSGTANTTPNAMRLTYGTVAADDWFYTNALSLQAGTSYQLQFKYRTSSATYVQGLEVKVGSAATVAGQTAPVFSNTGIVNTTFATTAAGGAPGQVILFTPTTSGIYYYGFHAISSANFGYLYVDDVQVSAVPTPACQQPTGLAVSGITSTGVTVTFTGTTNSTAYNIIYGPRNFNPSTAGTTVATTASPFTLGGLTQNTNYDVYVQTTCGTTGTSLITGPLSFLTSCATTTTFPYFENFDGVTAPALPCGVTVLDSNNDGTTWKNAAVSPNSSPNAMQYMYNGSNVGNDWFFTNALYMQAGATYQLQFKYRGYGSLTEAMEVKVGNAATAAGQTTTVFTNNSFNSSTYTTTTAGTGANQVAGFTPTTSGVYYFGFHAISPANQWYIYVDDVQVDAVSLAACPTPTNVVLSGITANSATVSFTGPTALATGGYTVIYGPTGFNPATSGTSVTGTASPIALTGLTSLTGYDVYVKASCAASVTSFTSAKVSFVSACATTITFPYLENFDGVTAPALPCGVTVLDANSDGSTWVNSNDFPSSGANSMRYMPSAINGADDWFFLNAMSLQANMRYQLSFKYKVFSYNYPERMEVKIGNSTTPASQTTTLFSNNNMLNSAYLLTAGQVASFVPPTSGTYFIGFHATSTVNSFSIYVDDVSVTATTVTSTKSNVAPGFSAEASPVPFNDHLTLTLNTLKAGPLQLTLHDAVGRVVRETTANVPAGASSMAVPNAGTLPAGMYLLTVRQGGNTQVIRVAHE